MMKNTKWILSTVVMSATLLFSSPASADCCCNEDYDSGFYFGALVGYVDTNWDDIDENAFSNQSIVVKRDYGAGVRPFVGYQVNQYFAVEFGWTYLNNAKFDRWDENDFENVPLTTIQNQAYDLSMRLSIPLFCCPAGIFARVGASYLISQHSIKWVANSEQETDAEPFKHNPSSFDVVFGLGAYWDFTCKLRGEVSWMRFGGHRTTSDNYQPSPDFFSLGLTYRL